MVRVVTLYPCDVRRTASHVPRLAIKSSLGRTRTEHSCGRARFKEPFGRGGGGRLLGPGGGPRCGGERKVEAASEKIASGCYILRDRDGARPARAAARYLIWLLSEPRVAVFWPGIVLRGFTFISILITRSLGSRFGTRYPSSTYTHTLLFLLLLLPRSFLSPSPLLLSRSPASSSSFSSSSSSSSSCSFEDSASATSS